MQRENTHESLRDMGRSVLLSVLVGGALLFASLPLASSTKRWRGLALLTIWVVALFVLWSYTSLHLPK